MKLIGLSGVARSGKDSAAQALIDHGYVRIGFADAVREMALAIDPIVYEKATYNHVQHEYETEDVRLSDVVAVNGWDQAKAHFTEVRRLLQAIGTEAVRNIIGPETWIEIARRKVDGANAPVVITDVRFPNEAEFIRSLGGKVVRICRPGLVPVNGHSSELLEFEPDSVVVNDGSIEQLQLKVLAEVSK